MQYHQPMIMCLPPMALSSCSSKNNEVQIQFHMGYSKSTLSSCNSLGTTMRSHVPSLMSQGYTPHSYGNLNTSARIRTWKEKHCGTPMFTLSKHCRWDGLGFQKVMCFQVAPSSLARFSIRSIPGFPDPSPPFLLELPEPSSLPSSSVLPLT